MKEQKEVDENHLVQQAPWLLNNAHFCYNGELPTKNDNEKNNLYSINKNIKIPKELTQTGQRAWEGSQALQQYSQILPEKGLYQMGQRAWERSQAFQQYSQILPEKGLYLTPLFTQLK